MSPFSFLTDSDTVVAAPLFAVATGAVLVFAPRLTSTVDALAERSRFGRTLVGSVLLGASTSMPGIVVTVVATLRGDVALAVANAVGGVAVQTTFLAVADIAQRRTHMFRNAATSKALTQLGMLLVLLAIPLFAVAGWPDVSVGRLHPTSIILVLVYAGGMWISWREPGEPDEPVHRPTELSDAPPSVLWLRYARQVAMVAIAGFVIGTTISPISDALGIGSVAAGALITAGATSTPELVTAVTAARRMRLHLAVGDIVGGNTFDILFLAVADLAFATSVYTVVGGEVVLLIASGILLNALLLLGFVRRGSARSVSLESWIMLGVYLALAIVLLAAPPG